MNVSLLYCLLSILKYSRENVTSLSIKDALDMLPVGLCFANFNGSVALKNLKMDNYCREYTGEELKNIDEFLTEISLAGSPVGGQWITELGDRTHFMALRQLSKSLLPYFKEGQQNVLNLLSTDASNGKSYLAQELENYWLSLGLQVRRLTYDEDFLAEDSRYIMAKSIKDICPDILPNEIAIIEYPNLDDNTIASSLLNLGTVNLMVTRANRTWKDVDQKALKELESRLENKDSLFMYLTEANRYAVEEFVGQLPPYTRFNNFVYRISQLGLTATENNHAK